MVGLLRRDGVQTYLELGPGEVLARMLDECPRPDGDGTDRTPAVLTVARDRRCCWAVESRSRCPVPPT
ncbi:hypothetical protein IQ62_24325 [Streptomyces scabiei]|nr:hypothetical protein IQ62_24325 [Streptomyces scabiei]